jgi:hypothetical protein
VNLAPYWAAPTYEGYPAVDICNPQALQQMQAAR